jgi:Zn-dependent peptidase ImmA (M78 family)/transcriptional regulator with XRE-family HTH domain
MARTTTGNSARDQDVNPEMITLAREARGRTQKDLAERLDISPGYLSKVEAGLMPVSDALLEKLCSVLDYPKAFFFQTSRIFGPSTSEFYHRKRAAASAREIARIHAEINIRMAQIARLLRSADLNTGEFPRIDPDEHQGSVSEVARAVRAGWNIPRGPIKSVVGMIEDAGGIVVRFPFKTGLVDAVSRWVPGLPPMFFVNEGMPPDRERMTLCHEIGHLVMHQSVRPEIEDEANKFAGALLMPEEEIRTHLHDLTLHKLAALKSRWKVSMQALVHRAGDLGIIGRGKLQYLYIQLSKAGYRTREPAELDPPHEEASTLQQLIDVHTGAFRYSTEQMATLLYWNQPEAIAKYRLDRSGPQDGSPLRVIK